MKAGPKALPPRTKLPPLRARTAAQKLELFARRYLRHVKGSRAGQPLILTPWQVQEIIRPLFNTRLPSGLRQYREAYVTIPRKNGKSTLGAAIGLYMLYADGEPGAEIISAAADTDQAAIIFDIASSMVQAEAMLRDMTQIYRRELVVPATGSRYRVISAEAGTKHGMNVSTALMDELHIWPSRDLYDVLVTSTGARDQPLIMSLTTAGDDEHGICAEIHRRAEQVRDGVLEDPTLLPVIYAAAPEANPWDPAVWAACNPGLGDFRSFEEMAAAARLAQAVPGREPAFRRFYLNQWGVHLTPKWLVLADWDACRAELPPWEGRPVWIGLDSSTTTDLTALVLVSPQAGGFDVHAEFWCPAEHIAKRTRQDRVPYELWRDEGYLIATPGNAVDETVVEARLYQCMRQYAVQEIGVDPWNVKGLMARLLQNNVPALEVPQTMAHLTSATKALERLVLTRQLRHDGHPILRWNVANAVLDLDGNENAKPSKKKSTERIDGVSALVTALARALQAPKVGSVYDQRGVLTVG